MLVVLVHASPKSSDVSSVYWNTSEALTPIGSKESASYHEVWAFRLLNPTATTANIVVNYSAAPSYGSYVVAFLLTGVDSGTPTSDNTDGAGTGATSSVAVPNCAADDMAVAVGGCEYNVASYSTTTGTTLSNGLGPNWADSGSAYNAGSGSVTVAFSHHSAEYCIFGFRIHATAGGGGGDTIKLRWTK
jgi:hypothetical protein